MILFKKLFSYTFHKGTKPQVPPIKKSKMVEQVVSLIPKKFSPILYTQSKAVVKLVLVKKGFRF